MSELELVIREVYGNCPVQAEGTVNGHPFYFRARGVSWSLEVACQPDGSLQYLVMDKDKSWVYRESWGNGPFQAGWMDEDEARRMIQKGAEIWLQQKESTA